ncbi:MAG: rRNA maturation RNase YbeY [Stellaceae bacterium]
MTGDPDPDPRLVIELSWHSPRWRRTLPGIGRLARDTARAAILATGSVGGAAELSLVFTDDDEIQALNRRWRGQDKPTNVLSFPVGDTVPIAGAPVMLGDVVLAYATVAREAAAQGKPFAHHVRHLLIHGVLHLLGHDHARSDEAAIMERLECRILAGFGVPDPYLALSDPGHG